MCEKKPVIYSEIEERIIIPESECQVEYQVNKYQNMTWDYQSDDHIETPEAMKNFFNDIEAICKKYNFSISHQDTEGAFEITKYDEKLMSWFRAANKNYNEP